MICTLAAYVFAFLPGDTSSGGTVDQLIGCYGGEKCSQRKYDLTSQPILVSLSAGMGGTVDLLGIKSLTDIV